LTASGAAPILRSMAGGRRSRLATIALGYDRASHALLLFGDAAENTQAGPGEAGIPLADTWTFTGGAWTELSPGSAPTARSEGAMAYDANGHRLILFSGIACPFRSETWARGGTDWKLLQTPQAPPPRIEAAFAADPAGGELGALRGPRRHPMPLPE
jgi:hypothetical protein